MSTTFCIIQCHKEPVYYDNSEEVNVDVYFDGDIELIATRGNGGAIYWKFPIAIWSNLPDSVKVYPVDNTAQGIYTIGDLKREYFNNQTTQQWHRKI